MYSVHKYKWMVPDEFHIETEKKYQLKYKTAKNLKNKYLKNYKLSIKSINWLDFNR